MDFPVVVDQNTISILQDVFVRHRFFIDVLRLWSWILSFTKHFWLNFEEVCFLASWDHKIRVSPKFASFQCQASGKTESKVCGCLMYGWLLLSWETKSQRLMYGYSTCWKPSLLVSCRSQLFGQIGLAAGEQQSVVTAHGCIAGKCSIGIGSLPIFFLGRTPTTLPPVGN